MPMKKRYYLAIGVLLVLIITNPGMKAFKDYLGCSDCNNVKRDANLFIGGIYTSKYNGKYLGFFGNFFLIEKYPPFQLLPK